MTNQCVATEVMETFTAKNFVVKMAMSKQFLANFLFKPLSIGEGDDIGGLSFEVIMDKINALSYPNCCNFVSSPKRLNRSRMGTRKDHLGFKYVHGSRFPRWSKDKILVFEMFVDLPKSVVDHVGGYMENSWILFDHVKRLQIGQP